MIWPLLLGWRLPQGPRQPPEHWSPAAYYSPCLHTHRTNPARIVLPPPPKAKGKYQDKLLPHPYPQPSDCHLASSAQVAAGL